MNLLKINVSRSYRAPCSMLWELLTDTAAWPEWGPSIMSVECSNRYIEKGTEGRVRTAAGLWVPFIITGYEKNRSWEWKVAGIPATGHRVEQHGKRLCRVTFEVPLFAAPYTYVCRIALERIGGLIEKRMKQVRT